METYALILFLLIIILYFDEKDHNIPFYLLFILLIISIINYTFTQYIFISLFIILIIYLLNIIKEGDVLELLILLTLPSFYSLLFLFIFLLFTIVSYKRKIPATLYIFISYTITLLFYLFLK